MILGAIRAGLREIFTLRVARATVESYGAERLETLRDEKRIARAKLAASRRLANPRAALDLLTLAATHARRAEQVADAVALDELPVAPLDGASFGQLELARDELDVGVARALARIESRTPTELAGLRWGRIAAIVITLLVSVAALAKSRGVHDVARGKMVSASSVHDGKPEAIVDGRTRGTFAMQTSEGAHPFIAIDLGRTYRVSSIRVFNRGDGWFDESLPLSIEISTDGVTFHEIARRTEHFDVWTIDLSAAPVDARAVRATKASGYIALNEIEVYARE